MYFRFAETQVKRAKFVESILTEGSSFAHKKGEVSRLKQMFNTVLTLLNNNNEDQITVLE